jgi:hypothetical protein
MITVRRRIISASVDPKPGVVAFTTVGKGWLERSGVFTGNGSLDLAHDERMLYQAHIQRKRISS